MGKILVLAEKPSVARELARVLGSTQREEGYLAGSKYIVTWALGHLVTLADPETYDPKYKRWNMDDLPMLPDKMKIVTIKETSRQFKAVSDLMKRDDVDSLVIATDAGREGELVARWIMEKAGWKKPAKRLWISSQTDKAIKEGFDSLKPASGYDTLFKSARARSQADWLVGLNVTRALTCRYNAQLSAGRVQTPTLALIVDREEEIRHFVPKEFWTIRLGMQGMTALWRDKSGNSRLFDKMEAEKLCARLQTGEAKVLEAKRLYKHTPPPAAYDLTELQRDANKHFAYSAKETLSLMQSLYERHKVLTYPRTDSRYISDDVISTLPERLKAISVGDYTKTAGELLRQRPLNTKYLVNNAKVSDHHAIIPTEESPDFFSMTGAERNIYDLVVRRFMAVLSRPFEYEETTVLLEAGGERFGARGKIVKNIGWKAVYGNLADDEEEDMDDAEQSLPDIRQGDRLKILGAKSIGGKTKPPARYNEASLLTAMENPSGQVSDKKMQTILRQTAGLGTPATRADIIEKLFSSFYIERHGKELHPTSKGIQLISLVPPDLKSAELTARWELKLAEIAAGRMDESAFIGEMRGYAKKLVTDVKASGAVYRHDNVTKEKCPDCGKFLLDVAGKKGKMLVCPDRDCGYRKSVSILSNARCPNCHKKMELRGGGDDRLFVCPCGFRQKLSDFEKTREEKGAGKTDVAKYLNSQQDEPANTALAQQLAKWMDKNK